MTYPNVLIWLLRASALATIGLALLFLFGTLDSSRGEGIDAVTIGLPVAATMGFAVMQLATAEILALIAKRDSMHGNGP